MADLPKNLPVAGVADELGLPRHGRRYACPACRTEHDRSDKRRGPLWHKDTRWACANCGERGDAITLIAWATTGQARPRGPEFAPVLQWLADRNHVDLALRQPEPPPRAPVSELRALLHEMTPVHRTDDEQVLAFLRGRALDPARVPAGVLPHPRHPIYRGLSAFPYEDRTCPWWPRAWSSTWRLAVPAWTGTGELAGLHARAVTPEARPKARWPVGVDCAGLLFADPWFGRPMLQGKASADLERVVILEGITDYLTFAAERLPGVAVLGIESGSAPALRLVRIPRAARIYVGTDPDQAGDAYATAIAEALAPRAVFPLPLRRLAGVA